MRTLKGKYAVVTGAGKGIGAAIAKRFITEEAAGVALLDYDDGLAQRTAAEIDPSGERVLAVQCDVGNEAQVAESIKTVVEKFGTIDILVNNAGITRDAIFHKMTDEAWQAVLNVNLNGTYYTCKYVFSMMREKCYGRIVNISSTSAFGNPGQANYAASKGAVIGFTKTLAKEGGSKNITVNCIAPGFINTDMAKAVPPEILAEQLRQIPLKRLGEPEDIAAVAAFLGSDDAGYVSGQCIVVSGGSR